MASIDSRSARRAIAAAAAAFFVLPASAFQAADTEALMRFLDEQRDVRDVPGLSAAVVHRGTVLGAWGVGRDSTGAPMTERTRTYIGSASKAFTALALMQLVEAKLVLLDSPAVDYLPEFRMADPRAQDISVRQLLTHTSGMDDSTFQEWTWPSPKTLRDSVARLAGSRLAHTPGTRYSYHNPNYYTAARLIEVVSGMVFAEYLHKHIFSPLGMLDTSSVDFVREHEDMAALGHIHAFGIPIAAPHPEFFINGAGGIVTTASDMAAWLAAQTNGGVGPLGARILSDESMLVTHAPAKIRGYGYALGWNTRASGLLTHSGGLATYSAYVAFTPGGYGVVVLAPAPFAGAQATAFGILDLLQGRTPRHTTQSPMPKIDMVVAGVTVFVWYLGVRGALRSRDWALRMRSRSVWRITLGLLPLLIILGGILWGIPFAVSRVESWSWIWLAYYIPVWFVFLFSLVAISLLVFSARIRQFMNVRRMPC